MKWLKVTAATFCLLVAAAAMAQASPISYVGTVGGQSVNVSVDPSFGSNSVTFTLLNLQINPTSVIQGLSGIGFTLSGGLSGSLVLAAGQLIDVAGDGSVTLSAGVPDWVQAGPGFYTTALGPSGPDHLLLGAPGIGGYTNANGSIAGNGPHNPFVMQALTLGYSVPGASQQTVLESLTLFFGTGPTAVTVDIPPNDTAVPEPASAFLCGVGFLGLGLIARKRHCRT